MRGHSKENKLFQGLFFNRGRAWVIFSYCLVFFWDFSVRTSYFPGVRVNFLNKDPSVLVDNFRTTLGLGFPETAIRC